MSWKEKKILQVLLHGKYRGGGNSHVKAYRDVLPKWVTFSPKILDMGSILVKKSLQERPISQNYQKIVKAAIFEVGYPLEMGPDL